ncbi:hypothetical protein DFH07DRAFT_863428 [Mycena maculata]|uniref:Ankyrin repeat protein n=1 Tax=Mycena maculata TaxID=230809 RepID=A0AAD7H814_9AGAR|nr:hypothetical protein DFH07DRAFT_863428 [Mycena maculata]
MPVPLWTNKAEARYNVTTEFPSLGLHSAAATGNVGLVEYALARGQPINSVLDGVLPLHAAAAGGNERVVKLLIERGADVNAPRLPRRYSNDKNRDTSAPIVGTSGSTPLHFAAANGNTNIVTTLLLRGAHPNRADKHGITPEMLARQNKHDECAEVLKAWVLNKDRDLRERQGPPETDEPIGVPLGRFASRDRDGSVGEGEGSTRRRIHMKRSMDTALSMLKGSSPGSADAPKPPLPSSSTSNLPANTSSMTPPPSPMKPFGEYTFYSNSPSPSPIDPGSRRPSLPQITYPVPPTVNRKTSLATRANPRRPRSAGTDAEGEAESRSFGRGGAGKKLVSKYSLLNMFKKGAEASGSGPAFERTGTQASTSTSVLPPASALSSSSSVALSQPLAESSPSSPLVNQTETAAPFMRRTNMPPSPQLPAMQKSPPRPPIPLAVDLHNALAQHQQRERSGSGASAPFEAGLIMGSALNEGGSPASTSSFSRLGVFRPGHVRDRSGSRGSSTGNRSGSVFDDDFVVTGRPGILRAHNRSISGGPAPPAAVRALRFDPASGGNSRKGDESPGRSGSALGLRGSTSAGSLSRMKNEIATSERELPDSAPAAVHDFDLEALEKHFLEDDDEDEYAYGRPLPNSRLAAVVKTDSPAILADTRPRGLSLTSSSLSSLSPALSNVDADPTITAEFPFSINEPPPIPLDGKSPPPMDNRGRGDSVSSTSTTESQINPQMSASGTTSGSGSVTVTTPLQVPEMLAVSPQGSPMPLKRQLDGEVGVQAEPERSLKPPANRLNERRSHTPLDINLSLISSHAQAEALVQKELQDILEMPVASPDSKGPGWTPLSARLAAYGESLELERKFRTEVSPVDTQETPTEMRPQPPSSRTTATSRSNRPHQNGVDRQNSLDLKPTSARRRIKEPKRPHTSSGTDSPSTESAPTHHSSRSTSAVSSQTDLRPTDLRSVPIVTQAATTATQVANANNRVRRARTPDPDAGLSRVSSLDGIESTDTELGPVLTRVSTAPIPPTRDKRDMARHIASANKLTRMGFSPAPQVKQDPAQTKRFGGLKSLMQTFKGKPA